VSDGIYLGIDIGTTNTKLVSLHQKGEVRQVAASATPKYEKEGVEYVDLNQLEEFIDGAIRQNRDNLAGISFSSIGESVVPVKNGDKVHDPIIWHDETTKSIKAEIDQEIAGHGVYEKSGFKDSYTYSLYKIIWMRRNLELGSPDSWLPLSSYFPYRYTGNPVWEVTQACRSLLFDVKRKEWNQWVQNTYGLGDELGRLDYISTPVGKRDDGIEVYLAGHDHITGLYAVLTYLQSDQLVYDSMGSASLLATVFEDRNMEMEEYRKSENDILGVAFQENQYYFENSIKYYGKLFESVMDLLGLRREQLEELNRKIRRDYRDLRLINFVAGGDYYTGETKNRINLLNLPINATASEVINSLYIYLSYMSSRIYEKLRCKIGTEPIYVVSGGVTDNQLFMDYKAAILGKELNRIDVEELTATGAALAAAAGAKDVGTLEGYRDNYETETIHPGEFSDEYIESSLEKMDSFYQDWRRSGMGKALA